MMARWRDSEPAHDTQPADSGAECLIFERPCAQVVDCGFCPSLAAPPAEHFRHSRTGKGGT